MVEAPAGPVKFLVSGEQLREGDIVLAYGASLTSLIIARCGLPPGRYSHSGMYYHDEKGVGRVLSIAGSGLESEPARQFLHHYGRLALVRPKVGIDTAALNAQARKLWERNKTEPLRFDLKLDKEIDGGSAAFFCDELLSYLYTQSGQPDPFVVPKDVKPTAWTRKVKELAGIDLLAIVSPNAVLTHPRFETLSEVQRKGGDSLVDVMNDTIVERIQHYVADENYTLRPPTLGSRILLCLERNIFRREYIRRLPSPRQRQTSFAVIEFVKACQRKTAALAATRPKEDWTKERIRQLTHNVCDAYRDRHFQEDNQ